MRHCGTFCAHTAIGVGDGVGDGVGSDASVDVVDVGVGVRVGVAVALRRLDRLGGGRGSVWWSRCLGSRTAGRVGTTSIPSDATAEAAAAADADTDADTPCGIGPRDAAVGALSGQPLPPAHFFLLLLLLLLLLSGAVVRSPT